MDKGQAFCGMRRAFYYIYLYKGCREENLTAFLTYTVTCVVQPMYHAPLRLLETTKLALYKYVRMQNFLMSLDLKTK